MPIATASSYNAADRPAGRYEFQWSARYYTNPDAVPNGRANQDLTLLVDGTLNGAPTNAGTCVLTIRLANNQTRTFDIGPFQNQGLQVFPNVNAKAVLSKDGASGFEIVNEEWHPPAS